MKCSINPYKGLNTPAKKVMTMMLICLGLKALGYLIFYIATIYAGFACVTVGSALMLVTFNKNLRKAHAIFGRRFVIFLILETVCWVTMTIAWIIWMIGQVKAIGAVIPFTIVSLIAALLAFWYEWVLVKGFSSEPANAAGAVAATGVVAVAAVPQSGAGVPIAMPTSAYAPNPMAASPAYGHPHPVVGVPVEVSMAGMPAARPHGVAIQMQPVQPTLTIQMPAQPYPSAAVAL
ncbi:hypothetical protein PAPYR_10186 [Paratrimastix pyriformis]|uniref:Uncharacterized protein n=1 Tax=Paratrimastix pyriformis TaxID=342808 RepID=A0ABQ8U6J9_9EUKA|nr:hypothetical protein PAPYR_10186 [Paratrimastix pyriformis]